MNAMNPQARCKSRPPLLTFSRSHDFAAAAMSCILFVASSTVSGAGESPLSADALRAKQEVQQRAREMARELVSGMLDVQLKQLEQNGLQKLDLYHDIQTMRKHI